MTFTTTSGTIYAFNGDDNVGHVVRTPMGWASYNRSGERVARFCSTMEQAARDLVA